jgi:hypothetical protein
MTIVDQLAEALREAHQERSTDMTDHKSAPALIVTAEPLVWRDDGHEQWNDEHYGFSILLDPGEAEPYCAAWGEGDAEQFATLDEAKAWCQREIDRWIARYAVVRPAPTESAPALPERLHPNESDAVVLWAEIHRLRAGLQGPSGFATWQDAATDERMRRVKLQAQVDERRDWFSPREVWLHCGGNPEAADAPGAYDRKGLIAIMQVHTEIADEADEKEAHEKQLQAQVEALRSALERVTRDFQLAVAGRPVRDMSETLAEVNAAMQQAQEGAKMNEAPKSTPALDIDAMVNRFLGWPLPKTFMPDCGISFDGRRDDEWNKNKTWPTGTNLFTADEAKAMVLHMLGQAQEGAKK